MPERLSGGCACGAVRYECDAAPMFMWVCHCRECQRASGGGGAVNVVFRKVDVRFTQGEPTYSPRIGTSGQRTWRGFCVECGSPLAARADLIPDIQGLSAASFDDPGQFRLVAHIWTDSAQPWDTLAPEVPRIAGTPTPADLAHLLALAHGSAPAQ